MRAFLVSSLGVVCATVLAAPSVPSSQAQVGRLDAGPFSAPAPPIRLAAAEAATAVQGSTRTIPLSPLPPDNTSDRNLSGSDRSGVLHLPQQEVKPFSLLGVTWDDPAQPLHGTVQVRTRDAGNGSWSAWQELQTHNDDAPDPDSAGQAEARMRGSTAPLWVGRSDAVEVRVTPAGPSGGAGGTSGRRAAAHGSVPGHDAAHLRSGFAGRPNGLRLELVDPDDDEDESPRQPHRPPAEDDTGQEKGPGTDPGGTADDPPQAGTSAPSGSMPNAVAPRPRIVTRSQWGANEGLRERKFRYTRKVKVAFVHHSATGNNYTCGQAPAMIRSIYRYHVKSSGWRDIGYNFLIDKCGTIYEGRAGGVTKPVKGAHAYGFNNNSMGVAVLGTYTRRSPSAAAVRAVARLTAWKLGLSRVNAKGVVTLTSGGGRYPKGRKVRLHAIAGHRDTFRTSCPGARLYSKLGSIRAIAAKLQRR